MKFAYVFVTIVIGVAFVQDSDAKHAKLIKILQKVKSAIAPVVAIGGFLKTANLINDVYGRENVIAKLPFLDTRAEAEQFRAFAAGFAKPSFDFDWNHHGVDQLNVDDCDTTNGQEWAVGTAEPTAEPTANYGGDNNYGANQQNAESQLNAIKAILLAQNANNQNSQAYGNVNANYAADTTTDQQDQSNYAASALIR